MNMLANSQRFVFSLAARLSAAPTRRHGWP